MPSDAVHGRSKVNRKTLSVATRIADPQTGKGRPKSTAYCAESERPMRRPLLRPLYDEPEAARRLPPLHDPVPRLLLERLEVHHRAWVGRQQLDRRAGRDRLDRLPELHDRQRAVEAPAVEGRAVGWRRGRRLEGRRARDGVARLDPRRHAAGDVVPVLDAVALERADHRARAEPARAEHGLRPVEWDAVATGQGLHHRQMEGALDVAVEPLEGLADIDHGEVAPLLEPLQEIVHGDLVHGLEGQALALLLDHPPLEEPRDLVHADARERLHGP